MPRTNLAVRVAGAVFGIAGEMRRLPAYFDNPASGYLQRIQWIVRDAQTVIAFGYFENRGCYKLVLQGETGWSVQMSLDAQNKTVYVYDESSKQWYTASWIKRKDIIGKWYTRCKFIPCRKPYLDFISTAVVGSRQPTEDMIHELEDLFQRSLFLEA